MIISSDTNYIKNNNPQMFKGYHCDITKDALFNAAQKLNKKGRNLQPEIIEKRVNTFWNNLQELKTRFQNNKNIDLKIHSLDGETSVWMFMKAYVKKIESNTYKKPDPRHYRMDCTSVLSDGNIFKYQINNCADKLELFLKNNK